MGHIKRRYEEKRTTVQSGDTTLVIEARRKEIAERVKTIKDLAYETFVNRTPDKQPRFNVFFGARDRLKQAAIEGGETYSHYLNNLKYVWAMDQEERYDFINKICA